MRGLSTRRIIVGLSGAAGAVVLVVLAGIAWHITALGPGSTFAHIAQPLIATIPAIAFTLRAVKAQSRGLKVFYGVAAASLWFTALGTAMTMSAPPPSKYPAPADYVNLGIFGSASVAVLYVTSRRSLTHLLDGLVFASSLVFVTWSFVLSPIMVAFGGRSEAALASLTTPACDILLISALLVTARQGTSVITHRTLAFAAAALAAGVVGGLSAAYGGLPQPQSSLTFLCWMASSFFYTCSMLFPARTEVPEAKPATLTYALAPYVPAAFGAVAALVMVTTHTKVEPVTFAPAAVAVACIVVRQFFALLDNVEMAKRLEASNAQLTVREAELSDMAYNDPLTRLANRRYFEEQVAAITADETTTYSIVLLDVDDFKNVNDTYGHQVGDGLLVAVGTALKASVRDGDVVARLGGDEFAVMLPNVSHDVAVDIATRIAASFAGPTTVGVHSIDVTVSVGVANSEDSLSVGTILRQADMAMYRRKRVAGKGGVAVFASI